jgi:hypothetical protein
MEATEFCAMPARVARPFFAPISPLMLRLRRLSARLAVALGTVAWLCVSIAPVHAQTCTTTGTQYHSSDTITTPNNPNFNTAYKASPYPSAITVPNTVTGTVTGIQVRLNGIQAAGSTSTAAYQSINGMELLLVSPSGAEMEFMGGVGDGSVTLNSSNALTILIGDGFPAAPDSGTPIPSGGGTVCWEPSAYLTTGEFFPPVNTAAGAIHYPQTVGSSRLGSIFNGQTAAGSWSLYLVDDFGNPDSIAGWDLFLTVNQTTVGTSTSISASTPAVYTTSPSNSVTFTATVRGSDNSTPPGTVAFSANGTTIAGCGSAALSGGATTCTTTLSTQGLNNIQATYSGSGSYTTSSGNMNELVEAHPTQTADTWCNSGSISVPDGPAVSTIYPSVINVSGYPSGATIGNVTVQLKGVSSDAGPNDEFLLVAPGELPLPE